MSREDSVCLTEREKGLIHAICHHTLDGLSKETFTAFDRRTGRHIHGKPDELFKIIEKMETPEKEKMKR